MQRRTLQEFLVFIALVTLGIALRLYFHFGHNLPNVAPVAGLALFAGYYFRHWLAALAVPVTIMIVCDRYIGHYNAGVMLTVYALLALPIAARGILRRSFRLDSTSRGKVLGSVAGLLACSLGGSILFFLGTNFACWVAYSHQTTAMYPPTAAGLMQCYGMALPFFRATLAGDMFFAMLCFTTYGVVTHAAAVRRAEAAEPALAA